MGGLPARGPSAASAFDVLDALLARLSDRTLFPALTDIVLAGHSAGAQLVQRYAAVGRGAGALCMSATWSPTRPAISGSAPTVRAPTDGPRRSRAPPRVRAGMIGNTVSPADCRPMWRIAPATLEARYVSRDLVYLLGAEDTDPQQRDLDRSCAGLAEGPNRLARGYAFLAHLQARHGALPTQTVHEVPGVAHAGARMLNSPCGLAALFDVKGVRMSFPAPFAAFEGAVRPEWIDSNDHMNLAYYVVLFDQGTDAIYEAMGLGQEYRPTEHGTFAAETHTIYATELLLGDRVRVTSQIIGLDEKRLHLAHEMHRAGGRGAGRGAGVAAVACRSAGAQGRALAGAGVSAHAGCGSGTCGN